MTNYFWLRIRKQINRKGRKSMAQLKLKKDDAQTFATRIPPKNEKKFKNRCKYEGALVSWLILKFRNLGLFKGIVSFWI